MSESSERPDDEAGLAIEGEFRLSWDAVERYYARLQQAFCPAARAFIAALRQAGYDSSLRAGHSMWTFMVSRSRHHHIRGQKPWIRFDFDDDSATMTVLASLGTPYKMSGIPAALTPEIATLLRQLAEQEIT
jgi:hypothetical protein